MKRIPQNELLDSDHGGGSEVNASLADLEMFNEWFGGVRTTMKIARRAVERAGRRQCSYLEVAAGRGYVCNEVRKKMAKEGVELKITLLDRAQSHLGTGNPRVVADARQLPFPNESFDFVACNLFVHHLSPEGVDHFANEALRVCRVGLLINDLIRNPLHLAIAYAGIPIYRSRLTRFDAPASVKQAYTTDEMKEMLARSGARGVEIHTGYLYRMGVIAWK